MLSTYPKIVSSTWVCKGDSAHAEIMTDLPDATIEWYATDKPGRPPVNIGKKYDYVPVGTSVAELKVWKFRIHIANPSYGMKCDFNDTVTVEVYSLPKNEFTISGDTLIAGDGEDYQWYWNGIPIEFANDKTYIPTKTGNYNVRYVVPGANKIGCKGNSTPQLITIIDTTNSIAEMDRNDELSIYPNPGNGIFHVKWNGHAADEILVLNMLGQQMLKIENPAYSAGYQVNIQAAENGLYLIIVKSGGHFYRCKVNKI